MQLTLNEAEKKIAEGYTFDLEESYLTNQPRDKRARKPAEFECYVFVALMNARAKHPRKTRRTALLTISGATKSVAVRRLNRFIAQEAVTLVPEGGSR